MTSPFIPCSFTYGDSPSGGSVMPMVVAGRAPSDSSDINYPSGYLWLSDLSQGGSGNLYVQSGFTSGDANWVAVTAGAAGALNTLSDGSTQVSPVGGNISLEGTANRITVTSDVSGHNITFSIPSAFIAPGSIKSTNTLEVGTDLTVNGNASVTGDLTVTGNGTITGDLTVTGNLVTGGITENGNVGINTSGAGTTTIGNAAAGLIKFDVGTGNFQLNGGGNTINIGTDAAANTLVIGNTTALTSVHVVSGTGDVKIDGSTTAQIFLGTTTQTGTITIGQSTAGQNVSISDAAPTASRTTTIAGGTVVTAAVTDTIDIGPDGATTNANSVKTVNINTGTVAVGQVLTNIATGAVTSGTHTTSIATGNRAAGTMELNIMTGTGTKTLSVGNADGGTTSSFLGPHNINVNQNNNTAINTGTSTGTVTIGNAAAGAIALDTAAGISLDAATASNFTVTGAGENLTLSSAGGSVLVSSTEDAALAIRLHANGGTSETIQIHSEQGTGVGSINLLSDVGGITLRATGLASADAINLEAPAGGIDIDGALQVNIASSQAAGTAVVITASNAAGGIDLTTGGGSIDLSSTGLVSVAANTASVASPTATSTQNFNVGSATFTGFTTASAAAQVFTITNSLVTTASVLLVTVCNEGANDAQMTVTRVKRIAGSFEVTCTNNGTAALNGNVSVNWWLLQA